MQSETPFHSFYKLFLYNDIYIYIYIISEKKINGWKPSYLHQVTHLEALKSSVA